MDRQCRGDPADRSCGDAGRSGVDVEARHVGSDGSEPRWVWNG
jgi:hypothetical protein